MNTIARKLPIFVLMAAAVATTALTIGAITTFGASNTHRHDIQLMGKDDSWASSYHLYLSHILNTAVFDTRIRIMEVSVNVASGTSGGTPCC